MNDTATQHMDVESYVATENWMSPLNKIIWFKAFKAKKTEVTIRDGRRFTCKYFTKTVKVTGETDNYVKVDPLRDQAVGSSFVPCGTFRMRDVTHISWITDDPKKSKNIDTSVSV